MKKFLCLLLASVMSITMLACTNKEAEAVTAKIDALGEITLQSEAAILDAEASLAALSGKDRTQVLNVAVLDTARITYDALVCEQKANELETIIHDLRPITLKSEPALDSAEERYNSADIDVKLQVENLQDLVTGFQIYRFLQVDLVEKKITAIGDVTLESEDTIRQAREAYDALEDDLTSMVYNARNLSAAEQRLEELKNAPEETVAGD